MFIYYSHQLFLYIQKHISTISWIRFIVQLFNKRYIDIGTQIVVGFIYFYTLYCIYESRFLVYLISFLVLFIITTFIKYHVHNPRPFITYKDNYATPNYFGKNDSFPSNHTVYFFGVVTITSFMIGVIHVPLLGVAVFIALTRIIGGVHYPHDVLAGVLFGTVGVWGVIKIIQLFI